MSPAEWEANRDKCWVQNLWSGTVNTFGAYPCEVMASIDATLYGGKHAWPVTEDWWKRTTAEFGDMVKLCDHCALAQPGPGSVDNTDRDMVVTIQRWTTKTGTKQVFVRCHDGAEKDRRLATTPDQVAAMLAYFTEAKTKYAEIQMSDTAAADQVARNGGPTPRYCGISKCSAQIPYAAAQCAESHPLTQVEAGRYVFGSNRRPPVTLITGGQQ